MDFPERRNELHATTFLSVSTTLSCVVRRDLPNLQSRPFSYLLYVDSINDLMQVTHSKFTMSMVARMVRNCEVFRLFVVTREKSAVANGTSKPICCRRLRVSKDVEGESLMSYAFSSFLFFSIYFVEVDFFCRWATGFPASFIIFVLLPRF